MHQMANDLTASVFLIVSIHIKQAEELDRYECTKSSWAVSCTPFPVLVSIKRIWNTPSYIDKSVYSKRVMPHVHSTLLQIKLLQPIQNLPKMFVSV